MRDIKFRAWDGERFYYKVLVGNVTDPSSENYTAHCIYRDGDWFNSDEHDSIVFEQYTGLKDKNGVEIYEGDIVRKTGYTPVNKVVKWGIDGYMMPSTGYYRDGNTSCELKFEYEVIGNAHENPELIKAP